MVPGRDREGLVCDLKFPREDLIKDISDVFEDQEAPIDVEVEEGISCEETSEVVNGFTFIEYQFNSRAIILGIQAAAADRYGVRKPGTKNLISIGTELPQ